MGKRYTDPQKWSDRWFGELSPTSKLFWLFLLDKVDDSGMWEKDQRRASFELGTDISLESFIEDLGDKVQDLGDYILVHNFVQFQQGRPLTEKVRFHQSILKLFDKHGLEQDEKGLVRVSKGLARGSLRVSEGLSKGIETPLEGLANPPKHKNKTKHKNKEGGMGGNDYPFDDERFHQAWSEWIDYRMCRNMTKPMTSQTIKTLFEDFRAWGLEKTIEAIRHSIRSDWNSIQLPHNTNNNNSTPPKERNLEDALRID